LVRARVRVRAWVGLGLGLGLGLVQAELKVLGELCCHVLRRQVQDVRGVRGVSVRG